MEGTSIAALPQVLRRELLPSRPWSRLVSAARALSHRGTSVQTRRTHSTRRLR